MVGGARCGPWVTVWCFEHCHKEHTAELRQSVESGVREYGGRLVCFKKSPQLGRWLRSNERKPFVLVADWREAQPCLAVLRDFMCGGSLPALAVVVLCEDRRQGHRAATWMRSLGPEMAPLTGCMHVCHRDRIPRSLLDGLVARCFAKDPGARPDDARAEEPRAQRPLPPWTSPDVAEVPMPSLRLAPGEVEYIRGPFGWADGLPLASLAKPASRWEPLCGAAPRGSAAGRETAKDDHYALGADGGGVEGKFLPETPRSQGSSSTAAQSQGSALPPVWWWSSEAGFADLEPRHIELSGAALRC